MMPPDPVASFRITPPSAEEQADLAHMAERLWPQRAEIAQHWTRRLVTATPDYFPDQESIPEQLVQVHESLLTMLLETLRSRDFQRLYELYYLANHTLVQADLVGGPGPRISLQSLYASARIWFELMNAFLGDQAERERLAFARLEVQLMTVVGCAYSDCREDHLTQLHAARQEELRRLLEAKASLKEKEILVKEVYHRVKNNLQVVSSLLGLQSGYAHDPRDLSLFRESQNRVRLMAAIHEALYKSNDLSHFDGGSFIRDITSNLRSSYGAEAAALEIHVDVEGIQLSRDNAVPCGMIINELVSNAMKHGFPNGRTGEVQVQLRCGDDAYVLRVKDNGIGLPAGMDWQHPASLGLRLVNALVRQIEGALEVSHQEGAEFVVTFPRAR